MDSEEYQRDNQLVQQHVCESSIAEYDIVQWSKLFFMHDAIKRNPFSTDYFIWIDAGYGKGEDIHPKDGIWKPYRLFDHADKVTFLQREDVEKYRSVVHRLHKMSVSAIPGGFFGGGSRALERLYTLQQQHIRHWLETGVVDDDQTVYMQLYFKHPDLIRLIPGNWFDAFKLFNG